LKDIANRLKAIRNETAEALGIERGVLMSNTVILEIARVHPTSVDELEGITGVRRWQAETLADRILAAL
jgi:ribonuclease D